MEPLDCSWGNPEFLWPFWEDEIAGPFHWLDGSLSYNCTHGDSELKRGIIELHKHYNQVPEGEYFVVIANGATQALQAAISALPKNPAFIYTSAPHFSRFPTIIKNVYRKCYSKDKDICDAAIVTIPNNPDGAIHLVPPNVSIIYDMCYNWPHYLTGMGVVTNNKFPQVYSLSKLTGHASTRFGWIITDDKEFAERAQEFIEHQTCGVSVDAQGMAGYLIDRILGNEDNVIQYGKDILTKRWQIIEKSGIVKESSRGMFLWVPDKQPYLEKNIIGMTGDNFGADEKYYRMNIGCSEEKWIELCRRCF